MGGLVWLPDGDFVTAGTITRGEPEETSGHPTEAARWKGTTGVRLWSEGEIPTTALAVDRRGRMGILGHNDDTVGLLDLSTGKRGWTQKEIPGVGDSRLITDLALSPDGRFVAAASAFRVRDPDDPEQSDRGGVVRLLDAARGAVVATIAMKAPTALVFGPGGREILRRPPGRSHLATPLLRFTQRSSLAG